MQDIVDMYSEIKSFKIWLLLIVQVCDFGLSKLCSVCVDYN